MSHTKLQARASSSVLPERFCSSGECNVTTQPAWATAHPKAPRQRWQRRQGRWLQGESRRHPLYSGQRMG
jgi:hypothetical protein